MLPEVHIFRQSPFPDTSHIHSCPIITFHRLHEPYRNIPTYLAFSCIVFHAKSDDTMHYPRSIHIPSFIDM